MEMCCPLLKGKHFVRFIGKGDFEVDNVSATEICIILFPMHRKHFPLRNVLVTSFKFFVSFFGHFAKT